MANKWVKGSQCIIMWHIDHLKLSHTQVDVLEDILRKLNEEFSKVGPLLVNQGKIHDYLGMILDYSQEGTVVEYIKVMLVDPPSHMDGFA